jgi:hypothetical protein
LAPRAAAPSLGLPGRVRRQRGRRQGPPVLRPAVARSSAPRQERPGPPGGRPARLPGTGHRPRLRPWQLPQCLPVGRTPPGTQAGAGPLSHLVPGRMDHRPHPAGRPAGVKGSGSNGTKLSCAPFLISRLPLQFVAENRRTQRCFVGWPFLRTSSCAIRRGLVSSG